MHMPGAKDDTAVEQAEIPDKEEVRDEQPKSLRDSIRAAVKEHSEDGGDGDKGDKPDRRADVQDGKDKTRARRARSDNSAVEGLAPDKEDKPESDRPAKEPKEAKEEPTSPAKSEKEEVKVEPPPFYKNKGKATWERLSPEDKQAIVAREKEVSDGFAQVSQRIRSVEDIERAIAPRLQSIQQFGVPPGVVVDRLFQWMENLYDPNKRAGTFKELARNFGVDLNQLASGEQAPTDPNAPPSWFNEFTTTVDKKVSSLESQLTAQKDAAIQNSLMAWAKDKPYYEHVAGLMGQLLQSGAVNPVNPDGSVNLDGAYEAAIKINPQVAALIQQEKDQKAAQEATDKALKEAKEKADRLARAKRAGTGLKPAAPSFPISNLNGKGPKEDTSVRGSIRAAIEEHRS